MRETMDQYTMAHHEGLPDEEADSINIVAIGGSVVHGDNREFREMVRELKKKKPGENPEDLARFDDCTADDMPLADKGITFAQRGSYLRPLFAPGGRVYWINECYIAPVEDEKNLAYFLRELEDGIFAVAVIAGLEIVALIGVRIAAPETEESLRDIFRGCQAAEQAGYRIPKEMVIAYGGYQIPVTGFIGRDVREWEERGEQEKIV